MPNASKTFKARLQEAIDKGTISKTELARKSGVSRTHIDRYLNGDAVPGLDNAEKIANALHIKLSAFIDEGAPPGAPDVLGAIEIMGALKAERKAGVDGPISKRLFEQCAEIQDDGG